MKKAVFLDRDGTIISEGNYIFDPKQVRLLPDAKEAVAMLRDSGFMLFLFTNQSGVGRGFFSLHAVHRCNQQLVDLLGMGNQLFTGICIAPESPDQPSVYRKPNPRYINESVAKYSLDRSASWMVGDKLIDVESGLNAGINAALIGQPFLLTKPDVPCYQSLLAFAQAAAKQTG